jgi:hypothetical protein
VKEWSKTKPKKFYSDGIKKYVCRGTKYIVKQGCFHKNKIVGPVCPTTV